HFQPEGRQAKCVTHRTGYEVAAGPAEIQRQPGIPFVGVRLDKKRGLQGELAEGQERVAWARVSPSPFWVLFRRGKSTPAEQTGKQKGKEPFRRKIPHSAQNK